MEVSATPPSFTYSMQSILRLTQGGFRLLLYDRTSMVVGVLVVVRVFLKFFDLRMDRQENRQTEPCLRAITWWHVEAIASSRFFFLPSRRWRFFSGRAVGRAEVRLLWVSSSFLTHFSTLTIFLRTGRIVLRWTANRLLSLLLHENRITCAVKASFDTHF